MTKNEARDILMHHNLWRRGEADNMPDVKQLGMAIDAAIVALSDPESLDLTIAYQAGFFDGKRCKSSIAQSIRDAAINWPQYLGDVECNILHSFCGEWARSGFKNSNIQSYLSGFYGEEGKVKARTFMLLVAEALE